MADYYRHSKTSNAVDIIAVDEDYRAESGLETADVRATVERLLVAIPAPQQMVLVLHYGLGASFAEVGETLGLSEEAARSQHRRAISKIRRAGRPLLAP